MRTQDFKTKLEVDWGKHGGKFTALLLRKPAYAAANHMTSTTEYQCTRLRSTHKQEPRIRMHGGNVAVGEVLIIGGEKCRILAKNTADVCVLDALPRTSASFMAQHEQWSASADAAINSLLQVWQPVWQRDTEAERDQEDQWPDAFRLIEQFAPQLPEIEIPTLTLTAWKEALATTKNKTAKGCCGFSCPELKSLPDIALADLLQVFNELQQGADWPAFLVTARACFLQKSPGDFSPEGRRPITVFSLLFRLWSKIVNKHLITAWADHLPSAVAAGIPGRTSETVWWQSQARIESAVLHKHELGGLVTDLKKCFNYLARLPMGALFRRLGDSKYLAPCIKPIYEGYHHAGGHIRACGLHYRHPGGRPAGNCFHCGIWRALGMDDAQPPYYAIRLCR